MKSEEENKEILINAISPFFNISEERWGKHVYGDKVRIDMIVQPKRHDQWRGGKNTLLGIEVKPDYDNFNHITGLLVQAIDYRNSKWRLKGGDFKHIPIFLYPNPLSHPKVDDYFLERFLGRMNIGVIEYLDYKECFEFRMSACPIFDTVEGAKKKAMNFKFDTKFGRQ